MLRSMIHAEYDERVGIPKIHEMYDIYDIYDKMTCAGSTKRAYRSITRHGLCI